MTANLRAHGAVHLDNREPVTGQLTIEQPVDFVSSHAILPKPSWSHVDSNGHWHAADDDRKFPTLNERNEPAECDGSCGAWGGCDGEGYTKTAWTCRICGEVVEPDFATVVDTVGIPGWIEWQVVAHDFLPTGDQLTVRFVSDGGTAFGVGLVTSVQRSSEGSVATITGNGPIGWRKADKAKAPSAIEGS